MVTHVNLDGLEIGAPITNRERDSGRPAVLVTLVLGFPAPTALPLAEESFHNPSLTPLRSLLARLFKTSIEVCVTPPQTMCRVVCRLLRRGPRSEETNSTLSVSLIAIVRALSLRI